MTKSISGWDKDKDIAQSGLQNRLAEMRLKTDHDRGQTAKIKPSLHHSMKACSGLMGIPTHGPALQERNVRSLVRKTERLKIG